MHTDRKEDEDDQLGQPFTSQSGYDRTPQQELAESEITLRKVESERSNYTESNASSLSVVVGHKPKQS